MKALRGTFSPRLEDRSATVGDGGSKTASGCGRMSSLASAGSSTAPCGVYRDVSRGRSVAAATASGAGTVALRDQVIAEHRPRHGRLSVP
jgi:hypothetical protein